jgi:predicted ABC-type ATPase
LPTLTIVAGPNGSGKTTLTKWVREEFQDNPVLDPDAIANSLQTASTTEGSAIEAGRKVLSKAELLIAGDQSFTVETTLSGHTYLRMMTKAKLLGYFIVLIYVATRDVEINIERVRNRVILGGHNVSEEDQRRRYPRSLANAVKAFAIADEGIVLDNSAAFYKKLAVKRVDGIQIYEPLPAWAKFLRASV